MPEKNIWLAVVRFIRRSGDGRERLILKIPCSCSSRARWLRKILGTGRVERGAVLIEGSGMLPVMEKVGLGKHEHLVREFLSLLTGQWCSLSPDVVKRQGEVLDRLMEEVRKEL